MKRIFFLIVAVFISNLSFSQLPKGFNYQAIARNSDGTVLQEQQITVRLSVYNNSEEIWTETHNVTTNQQGYFDLVIGDALVTGSGSAGSFENIPWSSGELNIGIEVDAGAGFVDMGTVPFYAVPYALYAVSSGGGAGQNLSLTGNELSISGGNSVILPENPDPDPLNELQDLSYNDGLISLSNDPTPGGVNLSDIIPGAMQWDQLGDTIYTANSVGIGTSTLNSSLLAIQSPDPQTEKPLFEVRNDQGNPVFAVFNDGVMVYVDESNKGVKGGFAVGGYKKDAKGIVTQEYLRVTPDSVRIYVPEEDQVKGVKGGFAVGGYKKEAKGIITQEYLRVTPDSVRIYVPEQDQAKGVKGGFAVGGYKKEAKGPMQDLLYVTPDSIRLYVPKKQNDPGYVGLQGGFAVETFDKSAVEQQPREYIMGVNRGITRFNTADNSQGFAIGSQGGEWGATYMTVTPVNTFVGFQSGANTRYDPNAWDANQGSRNVFLGYQAGEGNRYGHHNVFLGYQAGQFIVGDSLDDFSNSFNVLIGPKSGLSLEYAYSNVLIGSSSGESMFTGENNIFLGEGAGRDADGSYNNILIGTSAGNSVSNYNNVMIGNSAGYGNSAGNSNVFIGSYAGNNNNGSRNVFIGHYAGYGEAGDGKLYIENAVTESPLIYGDFNNDLVRLNAEVGINKAPGGSRLDVLETRSSWSNAAIVGGNYNSPDYGTGVQGRGGSFGMVGYAYETGTGSRFGVYGYAANGGTNYGVYGYAYGGTAYAIYASGNLVYTGAVYQASDAKFKEDIQPISSVLENVMKLSPRKYRMSDNEGNKSAGISPGTQYGLVAQEIEAVFPELVDEIVQPDKIGVGGLVNPAAGEAPETFKGVKYMELIPILIKGMQEQQEEIEALKTRIQELEGTLTN